jgi:uncharacterized protein YbbK (DUF523 family)
MQKILVSSCLLGCNVRYDGGSTFINSEILSAWKLQGRLISICPEVAGELSIPRPACEIVGGDGEKVLANQAKIVSKNGENYSREYISGAEFALALAKKYAIKLAILKKNSPSCSNEYIYDGTFTNTKVSGSGVTACLLIQNRIKVFNEDQLLEAKEFLEKLET